MQKIGIIMPSTNSAFHLSDEVCLFILLFSLFFVCFQENKCISRTPCVMFTRFFVWHLVVCSVEHLNYLNSGFLKSSCSL